MLNGVSSTPALAASFFIRAPAAATVVIDGKELDVTFTGGEHIADPVIRAVVDEHRANGTLTGTVTVTAS